MTHRLKSQAKSVECASECRRRVDQERGLLDLLLLAGFAQKQHGKLHSSCLKQPCMQDFVRLWIDGGKQPVTFVIHLNHRLIDRDVIRLAVAAGLYIGFLHPVVNRGATPFDTQPFENLFGIESDSPATWR